MKWKYRLGLAGVDPGENPTAIEWGRRFEWPLLILAIWIPIHWYLDYLKILPEDISAAFNWIIWLVFVTETVVLCALVRRKTFFLWGNWINLVIITGGFPLFWQQLPLAGSLRLLRFIVLLGVLAKLSGSLLYVLRKNQLGTTLLASAIITGISGIVISIVDPNIETPADGIWWAWVTITTVGYGDIVPTSLLGRAFAGILILFGVALIALLTANFSAALIAKEVGDVEKEMEELEQEENAVLNELKLINNRLERLEKRLDNDGG